MNLGRIGNFGGARAQGLDCLQELGFGVEGAGLGLRVWCLGFGVEGVGCCIWCLGFRVWGFGFGFGVWCLVSGVFLFFFSDLVFGVRCLGL